MTTGRLTELSRRERRRAILDTAVRATLRVAVIVGLYFVVPLGGGAGDALPLTRAAFGAAIFVAMMTWQVRRILSADVPELRAIESLAVVLPLFLVVCAWTYVTLSHLDARSFSEVLSRSSGLYFTVITFGTVGFGDISPRTDLARLLVSGQVLVDLGFLAVVVRIFLGAARKSRSDERGDDT